MGLKFSRELILVNGQIVPGNYDKENLTPVQERLIKKFPTNAFPFTFKFPVKTKKKKKIYYLLTVKLRCRN